MTQIIAEIGSVHDGSFGNACQLVKLAAACGADVAKFQTHISEAETLYSAPAPPYFSGEPRWEYFKRTAFSVQEWHGIKVTCEQAGIQFLSSPFSEQAVDLLESVGVGSYKIPSGEVTNLPMLERIAATGKPVYLSSGMSSWAELDEAVAVLGKGSTLTIMQCSSAYPCPTERVGLNVIGEMVSRYGLPVGFSDHFEGFAAGLAAAALGATVIEKHLTFSRHMYGSDAANGMEPDDFEKYCRALRDVWAMSAHPVNKNDLSDYIDMKRIFEKSIVTSRPLPAGSVICRDDLAFKKPGYGISAAKYMAVIGRTVNFDLPADHMLKEGDLQ
jgi:N,N'-diacetyllegionaminate synthase